MVGLRTQEAVGAEMRGRKGRKVLVTSRKGRQTWAVSHGWANGCAYWSGMSWFSIEILLLLYIAMYIFYEYSNMLYNVFYIHKSIMYNFYFKPSCRGLMHDFISLSINHLSISFIKKTVKNQNASWAWWCMPLNPLLGRQIQENVWVWCQPGSQSTEFQDSQGLQRRLVLKNKNNQQNKQTPTVKGRRKDGSSRGLRSYLAA